MWLLLLVVLLLLLLLLARYYYSYCYCYCYCLLAVAPPSLTPPSRRHPEIHSRPQHEDGGRVRGRRRRVRDGAGEDQEDGEGGDEGGEGWG